MINFIISENFYSLFAGIGLMAALPNLTIYFQKMPAEILPMMESFLQENQEEPGSFLFLYLRQRHYCSRNFLSRSSFTLCLSLRRC